MYCVQIVKLLVDAGANREATLQRVDLSIRPAASMATPLASAAMYGKLEVMQVLLGESQQAL
jgi:ankyrin repeat protein